MVLQHFDQQRLVRWQEQRGYSGTERGKGRVGGCEHGKWARAGECGGQASCLDRRDKCGESRRRDREVNDVLAARRRRSRSRQREAWVQQHLVDDVHNSVRSRDLCAIDARLVDHDHGESARLRRGDHAEFRERVARLFHASARGALVVGAARAAHLVCKTRV